MRDLRQYQRVIDDLVRGCETGQGQIGPRRVRAGVWNLNAKVAEPLGNQWRVNQVLAAMSDEQREVVAELLGEQFVAGVHEALVVLNKHQVSPFEDGYEGDPVHDFIGRLDGWPWPSN